MIQLSPSPRAEEVASNPAPALSFAPSIPIVATPPSPVSSTSHSPLTSSVVYAEATTALFESSFSFDPHGIEEDWRSANVLSTHEEDAHKL